MAVATGYHLLEIPEAGIKVDLPQELAYCNQRQYREMCDLIYRYQTGSISYEQFRYLSVYRLLDMKEKNAASPHKDEYTANIYMISELLDSFFESKDEDGKTQLHIKQNYIHNPIPVVQCGFSKMYGPEDHFSDVTFGQYVQALNYLGGYAQHQEVDYLHRMFATFYQSEASKEAAIFDKKEFEKRVTLSRKVYFGDIYGVFLLFASFQNYLTTAMVEWEGREVDLSILFQESKSGFKSKIPGLGMLSMTYMLAETNVFGKVEEVEQTNFWTVILRMYDIKKRDLDNEAMEIAAKNKSK